MYTSLPWWDTWQKQRTQVDFNCPSQNDKCIHLDCFVAMHLGTLIWSWSWWKRHLCWLAPFSDGDTSPIRALKRSPGLMMVTQMFGPPSTHIWKSNYAPYFFSLSSFEGKAKPLRFSWCCSIHTSLLAPYGFIPLRKLTHHPTNLRKHLDHRHDKKHKWVIISMSSRFVLLPPKILYGRFISLGKCIDKNYFEALLRYFKTIV